MDTESPLSRYEQRRRRKLTDAEIEISERQKAFNFPEIVVGEVWELEIGRFKVVSAGNKYVKLKRLA